MLKKKLDNRGLPCPQPVLNTKKALEELTGPEDKDFTLTVLVDNDAALNNVTRYAEKASCVVSAEEKDGVFNITIQGSEPAVEKSRPGKAVSEPSTRESSGGKTVYLFKSETLGEGSAELGGILMRGFIYAIKEAKPLPDKMLFMNGAVYLTTTGSPVLEDLQELENMGVEMLSCGTCLDYFQLKDRLQVGSITNLYDTADSIAGAARCITL